jgi:Rrf2 family iron-sulfur cluster assembly transcriptional regulator
MMLSTKTTYSVVALLDINKYSGSVKAVRLEDISSRNNISLNYLEQIFKKLRVSGIVKSFRGAGGGYRLLKNIDNISLFDVATAVDEKLVNTTFDPYDVNGMFIPSLKTLTLNNIKGE